MAQHGKRRSVQVQRENGTAGIGPSLACGAVEPSVGALQKPSARCAAIGQETEAPQNHEACPIGVDSKNRTLRIGATATCRAIESPVARLNQTRSEEHTFELQSRVEIS